MTKMDQESMSQTLLICSVGGTPDPVVKSLLHWRPARVIFIPSNQTRAHVDAVLRAFAEAAGDPLSPGQYTVKPVPDAENLLSGVAALRTLDSEVADWLTRDGADFRVVVDFTAGTKCMTATLALVARRWPCQFSYVGGQQRTKGGVGVVETGTERVVYSAKPWDALGYQAVEDAVTVFNHGGYAAAAHLLDGAVKNAGKPEVKRELATLKAVIDAYAAWDRFAHRKAEHHFADALKNRNDLAAIFPHEASALLTRLQQHRDRVAKLTELNEPTVEWVVDLMDNARRRAAEQRFDDAVARLYRACEALAQVRLRENHDIPDTKAVSLAQLPDVLRTEWANRGRDNGCFAIGLQDAYRLLKERGDELGRKFFELGLADEESPLAARNQSILAHGFEPVNETVYKKLLRCLLQIAPFDQRTDADDWRFPAAGLVPRES